MGDEILQKDIGGGEWTEMIPVIDKANAGMFGVPAFKMAPHVTLKGKKVYNPVRLMNEAQFGRMIAMIKLMAFELESDILYGGSNWNKIQRALTGVSLTKEKKLLLPLPPVHIKVPKLTTTRQVGSRMEADLVAAAAVNERFGGIGNTRALQGRSFRKLLTVPLMTPDFAQATMATTLRPLATPLTAEATLARGFWLRSLMITAGLATVTQLATDGTLPNLTRPLEPDWFVTKTATDTINWLGRFSGHFKLLYAIADDVNDMFTGESPIHGDDFDLGDLQSVQRGQSFIKGRFSAPGELSQRFLSQKDFRGRSVWPEDADPSFLEQFWAVAQRAPMPLSFQQYIDDRADQSTTKLGYIAYVGGLPQYPIDQEREMVKSKINIALAAHIVELSNGMITADMAERMASTAQNSRVAELGNRIRLDYIFNPLTGKRMDIDLEKVYAQTAIHMGYYDDRGDPDVERARMLGEPKVLTPKEQKAEDEAIIDAAFRAYDRIEMDRLRISDAIEEEFRPDGEYPTQTSAFRAISRMMQGFAQERTQIRENYGELLESAKNPNLKPTEQEVKFDQIRHTLDETLNPDGSIDHWNRANMLDQLEAEWDDDTLEKFWHHDEFKQESWLLRTWRAASTTASEYYEIPVNLFDTKEEFELWRTWDKVTDDRGERRNYILQFGEDRALAAIELNARVRMARRTSLFNSTEAVSQEVALWLLDGRKPRLEETLNLFKYHTGEWRPTPTEFLQETDIETTLEVLGQ